jgi:hypothetical protein
VDLVVECSLILRRIQYIDGLLDLTLSTGAVVVVVECVGHVIAIPKNDGAEGQIRTDVSEFMSFSRDSSRGLVPVMNRAHQNHSIPYQTPKVECFINLVNPEVENLVFKITATNIFP